MATTRLLSAMVATWNNVATTFTGLNLNVTDTASASGSLLADLQVGGASKFTLSKAGYGFFQSSLETGANLNVSTNSGLIRLGASNDVILSRDTANVLALRRDTLAQIFNIYNTYTDASNYERASIGWSGNQFLVTPNSAGTGAGRSMFVGTTNSASVFLGTGGAGRWEVNSSGHLLAVTDNAYDIGKVGADRPRTGYFGTSVSVGSGYGWLNNKGSITQAVDGAFSFSNNAGTNIFTITAGASNLATFNGGITASADIRLGNTGTLFWGTTGSQIYGGTNGNLQLTNQAGNDFGLLQFGDHTSSFPALRRTGAALDVVLADASAYSAINASQFISQTSGFKFNASTLMSAPADGVLRLTNNAGTQTVDLTVGASNLLTLNGGLKTTGATFALQTATTLTDNAAAQVATMTNGPTAGNPTKWIAINDNGVTRYIPAW